MEGREDEPSVKAAVECVFLATNCTVPYLESNPTLYLYVKL